MPGLSNLCTVGWALSTFLDIAVYIYILNLFQDINRLFKIGIEATNQCQQLDDICRRFNKHV